jgi:hypothetical protein
VARGFSGRALASSSASADDASGLLFDVDQPRNTAPYSALGVPCKDSGDEWRREAFFDLVPKRRRKKPATDSSS